MFKRSGTNLRIGGNRVGAVPQGRGCNRNEIGLGELINYLLSREGIGMRDGEVNDLKVEFVGLLDNP